LLNSAESGPFDGSQQVLGLGVCFSMTPQLEKTLSLGLRFQPKSQARLDVSLNSKPQTETQMCKLYGLEPEQTLASPM